MDNSIPFHRPEEPDKQEWAYRSDSEAIDQAVLRFEVWEETGSPVFTQAEYDILFQAGVFDYGGMAERFCEAVYRLGPVPGNRKSELSGEDVAPRPATGEVDYRGSQRVIHGGVKDV